MNWQERVAEEKQLLKEKTFKLDDFITSPKFSEISEKQQDLLEMQLHSMITYFKILDYRLKIGE